jgi:lipopolysaccharide export system permease protein
MQYGLDLTLILFQLLISTLPSTLVTVFPPSVMIGVLLGLGRMAADNEIAAIKSAGISIVRLLPPVLLLGMIGFGMSIFCTLYLIPRGTSAEKQLIQEALKTRPDAGIEERTFFDRFGDNLIIYVEKIDPGTGVMSRVFIRESSDPNDVKTILAKRGKAFPDPEGKAFILHLRDGTILRANQNGDYTGSISFPTFVFRYPVERQHHPSFEELSISAIRQRVETITAPKPDDSLEIQAYYDRVRKMASIIITQRFTHPLACLALAVMAFPLGVISMGKSRLNNVTLGLFVIFAYYALTLATERVARSDIAPAEIVLPFPFAVFFLTSIYLTWCVRMERLPGVVRLARRLILKARRQSP